MIKNLFKVPEHNMEAINIRKLFVSGNIWEKYKNHKNYKNDKNPTKINTNIDNNCSNIPIFLLLYYALCNYNAFL
jgi:hypothetical protein